MRAELPSESPFGTRFLDEFRRVGGSTPFGYATVQRIKRMTRAELIDAMRGTAGATYAQLQMMKSIESPEELARHLVRERAAQSQQAAMILIMLAGLG